MKTDRRGFLGLLGGAATLAVAPALSPSPKPQLLAPNGSAAPCYSFTSDNSNIGYYRVGEEVRFAADGVRQ